MRKSISLLLAGAIGIAELGTGAAHAAPFMPAPASIEQSSNDSGLFQNVYWRRHRGDGGAAAAVIGLGVLGAVIATQAARSRYRRCWIERQRVFDDWGNFVGYRRVRVCR
jgi:hypothetical protein